MKNLLGHALIVLLLVLAKPASALDARYFPGQLHMFERAERYESIQGGAVTYLKPSGHDEFEIPDDAILVEGIISRELLAHVKRLVAQRSTFTVYFDSPGGDLLGGLELGRLLHQTEAVAVIHERAQCKSACALAFLGAATRVAIGTSDALGFHRQYRLVDSKIVYGDSSADQKLIAEYLRSIGATGITAAEVVGTTGQATFSEGSLTERGLVTVSRSQFRATAKRLISMSGMTQFEIVSAICARYDDANTQGAPLEVLAIVITCGGRRPAIREPLLKVGISPWPFTQQQELELLNSTDVTRVLRSDDPAAIAAFNLASDQNRGNYQRYLDRRKSVREKQRE